MEEFPEEISRALQFGYAYIGRSREEADALALSDEAIAALYTAARGGYLTRIAEFQLHEDARAEADFIDVLRPVVAEQRYGETVRENATFFCVAVARAEPWDPESGDLGHGLYGVPGVGGKVRYLVGASLVDTMFDRPAYGPPIFPLGASMEECRRAWLFGFYLRCAVEADEHGSFDTLGAS